LNLILHAEDQVHDSPQSNVFAHKLLPLQITSYVLKATVSPGLLDKAMKVSIVSMKEDQRDARLLKKGTYSPVATRGRSSAADIALGFGRCLITLS
jgi:hypothetical protein